MYLSNVYVPDILWRWLCADSLGPFCFERSHAFTHLGDLQKLQMNLHISDLHLQPNGFTAVTVAVQMRWRASTSSLCAVYWGVFFLTGVRLLAEHSERRPDRPRCSKAAASWIPNASRDEALLSNPRTPPSPCLVFAGPPRAELAVFPRACVHVPHLT